MIFNFLINIFYFILPLFFIYKSEIPFKKKHKFDPKLYFLIIILFIPSYLFFRLFYISFINTAPQIITNIFGFPIFQIKLLFVVSDCTYWLVTDRILFLKKIPIMISFIFLFLFEFLVVFPVASLIGFALTFLVNR
jgi:hypothetical protein